MYVYPCAGMFTHACSCTWTSERELELELQAVVNFLPGIVLRTEPGSSVRAVCILKTLSYLSLQLYLWLLLIPEKKKKREAYKL